MCYYKVNITWCDYNHICQLSSILYKTAGHLSRGAMKLDLAAMNSIVMLLKSNPATDACALRPLLTEYVHKDVVIDATYIRNFRQRVAYFHASNPNYSELSLEEVSMLLEKSPITEEDHKILDDPVVRINFNDMLLMAMCSGLHYC